MVEARSMCRTTQHCFGFPAVLFSKAYLTGCHLTWWDGLHDTGMTPWRVVWRLLFMARPTSQLGVPISKLAFMLASPTSAFTWLSAKRQQTQNFHSRRTIGTVVRSYYTLRHDEPVRSVRFLFIYFLFFYKFSHGIKFSTVKKVTPGTSIEHLNDQNMFIWNWRKGAGRSSCSRSPTPICRMIKGFHSKSVPSCYPEKSIIFPLYFPSDWLTH